MLEENAASPFADAARGTLETLSVIGRASLFGVGGEVGLDVVAGSIRKSKQFVRPRTVDLVERGLVERASGKPLRFRLTGQERESLGLSDEE